MNCCVFFVTFLQEVPGWPIFVHPVQNFSVVRFDPSTVKGNFDDAVLSSRDTEQDETEFQTVTPSGRPLPPYAATGARAGEGPEAGSVDALPFGSRCVTSESPEPADVAIGSDKDSIHSSKNNQQVLLLSSRDDDGGQFSSAVEAGGVAGSGERKGGGAANGVLSSAPVVIASLSSSDDSDANKGVFVRATKDASDDFATLGTTTGCSDGKVDMGVGVGVGNTSATTAVRSWPTSAVKEEENSGATVYDHGNSSEDVLLSSCPPLRPGDAAEFHGLTSANAPVRQRTVVVKLERISLASSVHPQFTAHSVEVRLFFVVFVERIAIGPSVSEVT